MSVVVNRLVSWPLALSSAGSAREKSKWALRLSTPGVGVASEGAVELAVRPGLVDEGLRP